MHNYCTCSRCGRRFTINTPGSGEQRLEILCFSCWTWDVEWYALQDQIQCYLERRTG